MTSPSPPLYGSSRTTGGTTGGRAVGNVFNLADAGDDDEDLSVSRTGKVYVYNSPVDPVEGKLFCILKVNVEFSMAPVLKSIAEKWSPIESMEFYFI